MTVTDHERAALARAAHDADDRRVRRATRMRVRLFGSDWPQPYDVVCPVHETVDWVETLGAGVDSALDHIAEVHR